MRYIVKCVEIMRVGVSVVKYVVSVMPPIAAKIEISISSNYWYYDKHPALNNKTLIIVTNNTGIIFSIFFYKYEAKKLNNVY